MAGRDQPYRWHPTTNIVQLISIASRISLYLVDQSDIMDFTFKDRLGKTNKVHIGNKIYCTCSDKIDHCLHSIYVLLRIFKLPTDNPLLWQSSYLETEIIDIITSKYAVQKLNPMVSSMVQEKIQKHKPQVSSKIQRLQLNEESLCSICQEPMKSQMPLAYCKEGCGNNFHTNCLKIWIEHKKTTEGKVTCPMCRCEYGKQIIDSIRVQQQKYLRNDHRNQILKQKFSCQQCGMKQATSSIYKCLCCQLFCLCEECFVNKKHSKHPMIKLVNGEWQPAPRWPEVNSGQQQEYRQDYRNVLDYVMDTHPYVSKYLAQNLDHKRKWKFNIDECKCFCCGNDKIIYLRRLPCGHYIDDKCMKDLIAKNKLYCQNDGTKILKGYQNLLKIQQQIEKKIQESMKKKSKDVLDFLQKDVSLSSSDEDYSQQAPESLQDILKVIQEPLPLPRKTGIQNNIIQHVQHLPPISSNKRPSSIRKPIKHSTAPRSSSMMREQKPMQMNKQKRKSVINQPFCTMMRNKGIPKSTSVIIPSQTRFSKKL